ncbi:flagellar hook capping protein [Methylocella silvestris BL2]|uniref:Basal-body rod modification protein FlgD n=1 Tax=Methylocella silvestris (strain DSM 15510 / CIP 108128 / LMG 27833 / NCIMB 13906 / BL2) TaxID=395965 RepID=B8EL35_METSB|nr:flagellar hook assembly protein FlgD [Methylocella silvestris]ACK49030.1 flagellar hook capping protein [Methylocella silvestris BL2]
MSVANVNSVANATGTSANASTSAATSATVDYNQFLQLLITELKNQDPTSPTDPTQYMSQLASFSSVEQQVKTNSALDALLATQAGALIGKTATSADGKISGVIASVTTSAGGDVTATLKNGSAITLGSGVTISAT